MLNVCPRCKVNRMDSPTLPSSNVELERLFGAREGVVSAVDVQAALDETCLEKIVADTNANIR